MPISSVVEFLFGESCDAVKGALMAAVICASLLIANVMSQVDKERLQAANQVSEFVEERMLGAGGKMAKEFIREHCCTSLITPTL